MVQQSINPLIQVFRSRRHRKLCLRRQCGSPRRSRYRRKIGRRSRPAHKKVSLAIRVLVAPSLAGRYEIALLMRRDLCSAERAAIHSTLRDLIPRRFKVTCAKSRRGRGDGAMSRIYLVRETDLFAVVLAFSDKIWRIKRIVGQTSAR